MPSASTRRARARRQLSMVFDTARLRAISPADRAEVVVQLALLLMEAAGAGSGERDDGQH
ncbi:hypothetical protein GAY29_14315 [Azospirillum brasilense]|nr:hypothetical protein [Azospirillum brasilense]